MQSKPNDESGVISGESALDLEEFMRLLQIMSDEKLEEFEALAEQSEKDLSGSFLGLEDFVRLMHSLGDDALEQLAEKAETEDDKPETAVDTPEEPVGETEATADALGAEEPKAARKPVSPRRKRILIRQSILLAIPVILLILTIANIIYYNSPLNTDDPIMFADETAVDDVSCSSGTLIVNDVSVDVPADGSEVYSISYTWAKDDKEYPSVPYASVVSYPGKDGSTAYEISLYRNDTIKKEALPSGKTSDNWFDSWDATSTDDVVQEARRSGDINGFYIHPVNPAEIEDEEDPDSMSYNTYTYYFAVQNKQGISVYVLEGVCHDPEKAKDFVRIFEKSIQKIKVPSSV